MRPKFKEHLLSVRAHTLNLTERLSSPLTLAFLFSILSTASAVIAAYFEGRLINFEYVKSDTGSVSTIVPFIRNLSTLMDFIILNPLVIFFLQKSRRQRRQLGEKFGIKNSISLYHRVWMLVLSAVFGAYAMKFYVDGSQFFDATLVPRNDGHSIVTITGWIVYSWTAIYIAGLFFAFIEHGAHVNYIINLEEKDIPYMPFHQDDAAGVRFIMEPTLNFGYAMIILLITFVVFIIHDRILYHINSNRLMGFALYIVIALPLFGLPFFHLHRLMKQRRSEFLFDGTSALHQVVSSIVKNTGEQPDWQSINDNVTTMENADKYRKIVLAFPVWPVPISLALPPFGSIVAAALPLSHKLLTSAFPWLSILGQ